MHDVPRQRKSSRSPVGRCSRVHPVVIGPTLAGSAMVHVATTLAWFQHILSPSQVPPRCPHSLAQNFENSAKKSSRRKSRRQRGPFNGDCSTHANRCSGVRYIDDHRNPAAASQAIGALLRAIWCALSFFPGNFACFDRSSRFHQRLCGVSLSSISLTSNRSIISDPS